MVAANAARHIAGPLVGLAAAGGLWSIAGGAASVPAHSPPSCPDRLARRPHRGRLQAAWRALVVARVAPVAAPVIVLDGNTGSARPRSCTAAGARGHQVIDLRRWPNHRGSLLAPCPAASPAKAVRKPLAMALGDRPDPPPAGRGRKFAHWRDEPAARHLAAIIAAPRLRLSVPRGARRLYRAKPMPTPQPIPPGWRPSSKACAPAPGRADRGLDWRLVDARRLDRPVGGLMRDHYDPRYESTAPATMTGQSPVVTLDDLDDLEAADKRGRGRAGPAFSPDRAETAAAPFPAWPHRSAPWPWYVRG